MVNRIKSLNELLQFSVAIGTKEVVEATSGHKFTLNLNNWNFWMDDIYYNTCNGVVAFTDSNRTLRVIPKFYGIVELLENFGYHQNYLMEVPFSDGSRPFSLDHRNKWDTLRKYYHESIGITS